MLRLDLGSRPLDILCLGAHWDDVHIGCGGSLLRLLGDRPGTRVRWLSLIAPRNTADEARRGAERFCAEAAELKVTSADFPDGHLPYHGEEIKQLFTELRSETEPDVIFTTGRHDRHQDHRVVSDLTWQTWRDHLVLEYEIPKWDGDLGQPNLFIDLPDEVCRRKAELLEETFPSQPREQDWFSDETFVGLARLRGIEARTRYAEAFTCRKALV